MPKLNPQQIKDWAQMRRRFVLTLTPNQTLVEVRENPELWKPIQSDRNTRVRRGDLIDVVTHDGRMLAEAMPVINAIGDQVWLGKPSRIVEFDEQALYSDGTHEVIPVGNKFGIRNVRSGTVDSYLYETADIAKAEIMKRRPREIA